MEFNLDLIAVMYHQKYFGNYIPASCYQCKYSFKIQIFVWMLLLVGIPFWTLKCKCLTIISLKADTPTSTNEVGIALCSSSQSQLFEVNRVRVPPLLAMNLNGNTESTVYEIQSMPAGSFPVFLQPFLRRLIFSDNLKFRRMSHLAGW